MYKWEEIWIFDEWSVLLNYHLVISIGMDSVPRKSWYNDLLAARSIRRANGAVNNRRARWRAKIKRLKIRICSGSIGSDVSHSGRCVELRRPIQRSRASSIRMPRITWNGLEEDTASLPMHIESPVTHWIRGSSNRKHLSGFWPMIYGVDDLDVIGPPISLCIFNTRFFSTMISF